MKSEMAKMMKSPHHMLMTAHMKTMSEFARTLRDQAVEPTALDVEFARAAVAELHIPIRYSKFNKAAVREIIHS